MLFANFDMIKILTLGPFRASDVTAECHPPTEEPCLAELTLELSAAYNRRSICRGAFHTCNT